MPTCTFFSCFLSGTGCGIALTCDVLFYFLFRENGNSCYQIIQFGGLFLFLMEDLRFALGVV